MNLVNNGLHSFKKAFKNLCSIDENDPNEVEYILKDIILEFHHSFEVLFKAILNMTNPVFLYADLEKYYDSKFNDLVSPNKKQSQGFHTITFMQSFKRIIVLNNINIDNFCYQNLIKFNDLRNSLTHSETKIEIHQVRALIADTLFNIIPILQLISEFKEYVEVEPVANNLRSIKFIRDEWILRSSIFLVNYKNQNEPETIEKLKYKRLLQDIGYVKLEKADDEYISEDEYILAHFEAVFYGLGISKYSNRKVDKDNSYMMELITAQVDVVESATIDILKEKITNNLSTLLSGFDKDNCNFTKKDINEIQKLYKKLCSKKKLHIGLSVQKIENILMQYEIIVKEERRNIKISNKKVSYLFNKICRFDQEFYYLYENGKYRFTLSPRDFLQHMKNLFESDNILFSLNPQFEQYVSDNIANEVENFLCCDTWDFFWEHLMGSWGNWGTVDNISEINCYGIDAICNIKSKKEFTIWSEMEIGTEYYSDHEFYSDGSIYIYISLKVYVDESNKILLSELNILD